MRDQGGPSGKVSGRYRVCNLKKENKKTLTHSYLHRADEAEVSGHLIYRRPLVGPQKCIHRVIRVCIIYRSELFEL